MNEFKVDKFTEFEEVYNFFEYNLNGWKMWSYIRLDVYNELLYQTSKTLEPVHERKSRITLQKVINVILNCSIRHPLLVAKKKDILVFSGQLRNKADGKYKCRITDDIVDALGDSAECAELISEIELGHMEPVWTKHLLRCDYIDVVPTLLNSVYVAKQRKNLEKIEDECRIICQRINEYFMFSIDLMKIVQRAKILYIRWITRKKEFRRLIKKISPKIIVEVASYSASRMIMNEAAHELGIKVVELQHGVISFGHVAYNFSKKRRLSCMPDYLFTFSDFWKTYASYIQEDDKLISTGYPYFDSMKEIYPHSTITTNELRIIVISQHILTEHIVADIEILTKLLDQKGYKYHLIYKMHPRESTISIKKNSLWQNKNVELIDDPGANLYECFAKSDIQIGVSSSALFEGLGYGLKTYVLHYDTSDEYMGYLCKQGHAMLVENGAEIVEYIEKGNQFKQIKKNYFFMTGSIKNAVTKLRELAEKEY